MVDGKACNALMKYKTSQKCYNHGTTPKERTAKHRSTCKFGLSTLRAWVHFFERLLHTLYPTDWMLQNGKLRGAVDKEI
jgi:hypothetical protein